MTAVVVHQDGSVEVELPGENAAAYIRRDRALAVFVAHSTPPSAAEIGDRLRSGLRKVGRHD